MSTNRTAFPGGRSYFHAGYNVNVRFTGEDFAIIGNATLVDDTTILELFEGKLPLGWERNNDPPAIRFAAA